MWILGLKGLNFEITSCQHPKSMVSLLNRRVGRREDGKTLLCDKCDRAITCMFCRDHDLTPMFSSPLQKDLFKGN